MDQENVLAICGKQLVLLVFAFVCIGKHLHIYIYTVDIYSYSPPVGLWGC